MRKVKIIKCSYKEWWYNNLVGKTITIKDKEYKDDYIATGHYTTDPKTNIKLNLGYILKDDCILIQEVQ